MPSTAVLVPVLVLAALVVLATGHVLFWRWKLDAPGHEDELLRSE